jgi:hypothetical protein
MCLVSGEHAANAVRTDAAGEDRGGLSAALPSLSLSL